SKCVSCGRCAAVCPRNLISDSNLRTDMDALPAMQR
ncbi:MAG: 4Fe-4S binding protein, partial [Oscillospiraceae bacterium]|nr:4Fe-4S binding protein [Oscillospiraceae bacterium]